MFDGLFELEETAINQLRRNKQAAEEMRDLFRCNGFQNEGDNWSAVCGLVEQALSRFGDE